MIDATSLMLGILQSIFLPTKTRTVKTNTRQSQSLLSSFILFILYDDRGLNFISKCRHINKQLLNRVKDDINE